MVDIEGIIVRAKNLNNFDLAGKGRLFPGGLQGLSVDLGDRYFGRYVPESWGFIIPLITGCTIA
jgi:hypothetical protein